LLLYPIAVDKLEKRSIRKEINKKPRIGDISNPINVGIIPRKTRK
jgi:hypothetical protein|tara:strand:+ start:233 stop:367 length:135 start_codon:yes stop_codon:yes gene_type:complete